MANYNDVLGILREYRNNLGQQTMQEVESQFSGAGGVMNSFAARGGVAAFATPLSNVHATGVGVRIKGRKVAEDDFVIKVYVFDKADLGVATPEITKQYKGIDIDVEWLPIQLALAKSSKKTTTAAANPIARHRSKRRPIIGGVSIAPINEPFVGSLGCFVQKISNGIKQVFVLSNNHVLADTNKLPIGTLIVQPGPEVAPATSTDAFAALSAFIPIQFPNGRLDPVVNAFDAAIAVVSDEKLIQTGKLLGINKYDPAIGVAVPGMRVIKSGRTTGVTTGIVTATRVNGVQVNYGSSTAPRIATYNDTIQIVSDTEGKPFSSPGDSGSVILNRANGQPVALLFAGDGHTTTACDIGGVCKQFQVFPV